MNRFLAGALALALGAIPAAAQSLDDLNIQIHGYATQGFVYTTQNNWSSMSSSDGSPAWTEAMVNVTSQPMPKLRVGVQGRYFLLGNYGNAITLDWANADYKFSEKFGVRFGKVKTPEGLFNMIQDIDPGYVWSILPQSIYPLATRNSILAHYGGVAYGKLPLPAKSGALDYRVFAGVRMIASNDPLLAPLAANGILVPNGTSGVFYGGTLQWHPPLPGLMLGATQAVVNRQNNMATLGPMTGNSTLAEFKQPFFFGQYEHGKFMAAGEYMRLPPNFFFTFVHGPTIPVQQDDRNWFLMSSYKLSSKLTGGVYYSSTFDHKAPLGPARYQKDWTVSARYDVSSYVYLKAEQHFMDGTGGTAGSFNPTDNTNVQPETKMTLLKIGVSF